MPQDTSPGNSPLFIVGCVRSGTTLVRDLLRRQPDIICPEETHYFRYGEPFRTSASLNTHLKSAILKKHREIDGIPEAEFEKMIELAQTRGELLQLHVNYMAKARGMTSFRWFDKTPQNVYGVALINEEFPEARFLHLVRNPLNVVASLKLGKIIKVSDIHGACNYWLEAVAIMHRFKPVLGDLLLEMRYEDITGSPVKSMRKMLEFSDLGNAFDLYTDEDAHVERNQYFDVLTPDEQETVRQRCGGVAERYGYNLSH